MIDDSPFTDVRHTPQGFSLPELKWRELLFIGALRAAGGLYVRDASRVLPRFEDPALFRRGSRYRLVRRAHGRVYLRPVTLPSRSRPRDRPVE